MQKLNLPYIRTIHSFSFFSFLLFFIDCFARPFARTSRRAFSSSGDRRIRIFGRGHLSPIVPHRLDRITHIADETTIAVGEEMDRGEGEETREEVNLEEESSRICLLVGGRKIARSSGAAPQESSGKREKSATSGETSGDIDDDHSLSTIPKVAFVISRDASLYFCSLGLESGLCSLCARCTGSLLCRRNVLFWSFCRWKSCSWPYETRPVRLFSFYVVNSVIISW